MHREAIELCKTEIEELAEVNEFNEFDKAITSLQSTINTLKNLKLVAEGKVDVYKFRTEVGGEILYQSGICPLIRKINKYSGNNIKIYIEGE